MTDLSTTRLKSLIDQASPGPWTVEENDWDEIIVGNRAGHDRTLGEQVRFLFEAGNTVVDTEIAAMSVELAKEVSRQRGHIEGLIVAMKTKAANNEQVDPAIMANYLNEIILGENND